MSVAEIGIIGGSGLYDMPGLEDVSETVIETPFGDPSDHYVTGTLEGRRVAFLARHGRGHTILPTELNFRANIYGFKKLGVRYIFSASAVGSLREEHAPMDFVLPDQFIDRTRQRVSTFFGNGIVAHVSFADPLCSSLADVIQAAAQKLEFPIKRGGTYVCMEGPGLLYPGRVAPVPELGGRADRNDQSAGGQVIQRSRDLLCHHCHGDRLRLLA